MQSWPGAKFRRRPAKSRRLSRIVERCQELPGHELFQYVDDEGGLRSVGSADVNAYLREASGQEFSAKDFRTWAGTVLAAWALHAAAPASSKRQQARNVVRAVEKVAERLGNTASICRRCYVHPAVLESYLDGTLAEALRAAGETTVDGPALPDEELKVLRLIASRTS